MKRLFAVLGILMACSTIFFSRADADLLPWNPRVIVVVPPAMAITAGWHHTCALFKNGSVRCWGRNHKGQLGDGGPIVFGASSVKPAPVTGLTDTKALEAGEDQTCALLSNGSIKCWGGNESGQLGIGSVPPTASSTPLLVTELNDAETVAAGRQSTCAVDASGDVHCWGQNYLADLQGSYQEKYKLSPWKVPGISFADAVDVGGSHACARKTNNTVLCWGWDGSGQVGDGGDIEPNDFQNTPTQVSGLTNAADIFLGDQHSCVVTPGGAAAKCWGDSEYGQLGEPIPTDRATPIVVPGLDNVKKIASGGHHTCALLTDGSVQCWGANNFGQIGTGAQSGGIVETPTSVVGVSGATDIAAGYNHTCAVLSNGYISCWGQNAYGQLGDETKTNRPTPVRVHW